MRCVTEKISLATDRGPLRLLILRPRRMPDALRRRCRGAHFEMAGSAGNGGVFPGLSADMPVWTLLFPCKFRDFGGNAIAKQWAYWYNK